MHPIYRVWGTPSQLHNFFTFQSCEYISILSNHVRYLFSLNPLQYFNYLLSSLGLKWFNLCRIAYETQNLWNTSKFTITSELTYYNFNDKPPFWRLQIGFTVPAVRQLKQMPQTSLPFWEPSSVSLRARDLNGSLLHMTLPLGFWKHLRTSFIESSWW